MDRVPLLDQLVRDGLAIAPTARVEIAERAGRAGATATGRSCRSWARTSARARRCGRACMCSTATSWPGSTPTSATSSRASCTGWSVRCCASRGSSTSRASTGGRSARETSCFAEGGGRVTELMARPLINLFFPELSGHHPAAVRRVRRPPRAAGVGAVLHRLQRRDRPADRHPGGGRACPRSARSTWSAGSIATSRWATCRRWRT